MDTRVLEVDNLSKEYRLGMIGGGTLHGDLQSWFARVRGKDDPNRKIGVDVYNKNEYFLALKDVSFALDSGDALGVLGRNGAGKSTLLKLISRITMPTNGEIRIRGKVASLLEIGTGFHQELTGRENIYLNGAILGMNRSETTAKLKDIIEFSEIEKFIDTPVKRYSSGMYVKLAFAVAAHLDPDILICDEVLAVGDLTFQQKCLSKMSDVARGGRAVIYVSHNMRTVAQLCTRALFLESGNLKYDGDVARAIDHYSGSGVTSSERDLNSCPRAKDRGELMRMLKMHVSAASPEYNIDGCMDFKLQFRSNVAESKLRLRLILKTSSQVPLGMAETEEIPVKAGDETSVDVRFSMDGIAPGEYAIKLSLIAAGKNGGSVYYDTIEDVGHFFIMDDPSLMDGFVWKEPLWGNFRLKPLETLN